LRLCGGYQGNGWRNSHGLGRLLRWISAIGAGKSPAPPKAMDNNRESSAQDHHHRNQDGDRKALRLGVEVPDPRPG
jgi:hypothetical protein